MQWRRHHAEPSRPDVRGLQGGRSRRIGLVLGAGGAAGAAYHAGALLALQQDTGWDPRTADVIVGTSIGSIVASLLRAGLSTDDLAAWASGVEPLPAQAAARTLIDHISADPLRITVPRLSGMLGGISQVMPNARRLRPTQPGRPVNHAAPRVSSMLPAHSSSSEICTSIGPPTRCGCQRYAPTTGSGSCSGATSSPPLGTAIAASCAIPLLLRPVTHRQAPLHRWCHPLSDERRPARRRRRRGGHRDRPDVGPL